MKIVLQRVKEASVSINGVTTASINSGYLLLLGISSNDTYAQADQLCAKISNLRIFADENGKTNINIKDIKGEVLIVSQFTLYADCRKGNRPSFTDAATPAFAEEIYEYFINASRPFFSKVACGEFGAYMQVSLINDGPFTLVLESKGV